LPPFDVPLTRLSIIWMLAGTQYQSVFWTAWVRGLYMLYE